MLSQRNAGAASLTGVAVFALPWLLRSFVRAKQVRRQCVSCHSARPCVSTVNRAGLVARAFTQSNTLSTLLSYTVGSVIAHVPSLCIHAVVHTRGRLVQFNFLATSWATAFQPLAVAAAPALFQSALFKAAAASTNGVSVAQFLWYQQVWTAVALAVFLLVDHYVYTFGRESSLVSRFVPEY